MEELTQYLYSNNMLRYIEGYVQKVSPGKTPQVRRRPPSVPTRQRHACERR